MRGRADGIDPRHWPLSLGPTPRNKEASPDGKLALIVGRHAHGRISCHRQAVPADRTGPQPCAQFPPLMPLRNGLNVQVTGDQRAIRRWPQRGFLCATALEGVRASRMEVAA
jgi:hypothetical protein